MGTIGNMTAFGRWGRPALPKGLCYPHLSKHLVALLHGIRWATPPGTKAPAQSKSSRTTEETSLPLEQTTEPYTCTPWHSQTWHPGGCCTISTWHSQTWHPRGCCTTSSGQVNSPALLKPSQDLPAAFPRQPLALSPTTHLLPIPPSLLPAPRLPFGPSSNPAMVLRVSLAHASAHPLMPQPHMCPEASHYPRSRLASTFCTHSSRLLQPRWQIPCGKPWWIMNSLYFLIKGSMESHNLLGF